MNEGRRLTGNDSNYGVEVHLELLDIYLEGCGGSRESNGGLHRPTAYTHKGNILVKLCYNSMKSSIKLVIGFILSLHDNCQNLPGAFVNLFIDTNINVSMIHDHPVVIPGLLASVADYLKQGNIPKLFLRLSH